ncbi:CAP domain-containing protein [Pseudalkalibacillus decolorationis]|uniref:CAP domain-containing protein n=1 Tax=Pseudalkalibacillus decolorationis TaxID=163879 RepID=UPI0021482983|nr:CAP domain-containing protein [Pseudalkalibacillus decolorationis]
MKNLRLSILFSAVLSISMLSACNTGENQGADEMNYEPITVDDKGDNNPETYDAGRNRIRNRSYNGLYGQYNNDPFSQYRQTDRNVPPNQYAPPNFRQNGQQGNQPNTAPQPQDGATAISEIEKKVIELTNQEREKAGLSPLKANVKLSKVAQEKSNDMLENGYFSHNSPNYGSPFQMMQEFGVSYQSAGENIAAGQQSAEQVVKAWMNSPGHRRNIMNKDVTQIGVGRAKGGEQGIYWTQMFIEK